MTPFWRASRQQTWTGESDQRPFHTCAGARLPFAYSASIICLPEKLVKQLLSNMVALVRHLKQGRVRAAACSYHVIFLRQDTMTSFQPTHPKPTAPPAAIQPMLIQAHAMALKEQAACCRNGVIDKQELKHLLECVDNGNSCDVSVGILPQHAPV